MTNVKDRILKKFQDEIHQLDRELKTELPKEIKRARELGDLRENAEYQAAKERQRLVEARISLLQKRVSEISLMNLDRIPHDKVGFGSTVTLRDEAGHDRRLPARDARGRQRRRGADLDGPGVDRRDRSGGSRRAKKRSSTTSGTSSRPDFERRVRDGAPIIHDRTRRLDD